METQTLVIDKYEVISEIKRGGFGIVYKGFDRHLGKPVAIKAVDPRLLGEARHIDMFQKEAVSVAQLNHQNIVQIYDIKRDESGQLFIIMEYLDGPDLGLLMRACGKKNVPIDPTLAAYIVAEVCNGLDYAHNRKDKDTNEPLNFVHQDISPVNIMLTRSGEVKIIDFGMANFKRRHQTKGREVYIQGKIHYLAPEQVNGRKGVDRRTDIFAAGLILYELLSGERLIQAESREALLEALLAGDWDNSRFDSERIPERLRQVLQRALAHDPKHRYPNANLMYKELLHYLILTAPATDFAQELSAFIAKVEPEKLAEEEPERSEPMETVPTNGSEEASTDSPPEPAAEAEAERPQNGSGTANYDISDENVMAVQKKSDLESDAEPEPDSKATSDAFSRYYSFVEESEEDDQRTIIDVVRLSARTHQKGIIWSLVGLVLAFLIFTAVDTFYHFTGMGVAIYDYLFPPAIKIVSVPEGAQVFLDDELLSEPTPLSLDQISPGVHKLMLTLPEYEPIIKSINVPRQGGIHVSGEARRHASQPYILRFKTQFEISSEPPGASIYIDGVKLSQKTPATVFWEVSERPVDIKLELEGLPILAGLTIDTIEGQEFVDDLRVWQVKRALAGKAHYNIRGIFHKNVVIRSNPSRADIYLNESKTPVGVTGLSGRLMLPLGTHLITLRKKGYLTRTFSIEVNQNSPEVVASDLLRTVRIFARDVGATDNSDLGATIVEIASNSETIDYQGTTPAILNLLPYRYTVRLRKGGYHETTVEIQPTDRTVVARMEPTVKEVTIQAVDAITNSPVRNARVTYKPERSGQQPTLLGQTDANGRVTAKLNPGAYEVSITRNGYQPQTKSLRVRSDRDNRMTFRLTVLR